MTRVLTAAPVVREARLVHGERGAGLEPEGPGWFVVAARDALWLRDGNGVGTVFESEHAPFEQYGLNITALDPGQASAMYHFEAFEDEAFLLLEGRATAIVEGRAVAMSAGDLLWCPAGTPHVTVGAGDVPCTFVMLGSRGLAPLDAPNDGMYVPDAMAATFEASVAEPTSDSSVAYAAVDRALERVDAAWTGPSGRSIAPDRTPAPIASAASPADARPGAELAPDIVRGDGEHAWWVAPVAALGWIEDEDIWYCGFGAQEFASGRWTQLGMNLVVTKPGRATCMYHVEWYEDESFLILDGECLLIIEGEERTLRAGDFVHMPAGTGHVTVGTGEPCTILMVGSRRTPAGELYGEYPVNEVAARHGASVAAATRDPKVAYADRTKPQPSLPGWLPGR